MGRDPTYFPEPLRYLPDRWMGEGEMDDDELNRKQQLICGLAFGHGARMCIGQSKSLLPYYFEKNIIIITMFSLYEIVYGNINLG